MERGSTLLQMVIRRKGCGEMERELSGLKIEPEKLDFLKKSIFKKI